MSEPSWNPEQLQAITARGSDLLVAAAAGSGKTAVLVERLLRRVTEEGCDVDRFLVVTFTRAAAAEMLEKFSRRLTDLAAANPQNRRLRRQLRLLSRAHINTVHGFCSAFLRERFQAAGLPPDFRVLDADEADALRRSTLSDLLEARYEQSAPTFLELSDALSAVRDDTRLVDTLLSLHDRMSAHPHPDEWADSMRALAENAADADPAVTAYGTELLQDARHMVRYHLKRYRGALNLLCDTPALEKYSELFQMESDTIEELSDTLETAHWDEIRGKLFHIAFAALPRIKNTPETEASKSQLKGIRDAWKAAVKALQTRTFAQSAADIQADAAAVRPLIRELAQCAVDLDAAYTEAKRRKSCVDFSDLEHLTLMLLQNPDGTPSKTAAELSGEFIEIMVDEYQDTNAVQDAIFSTLSCRNLFTVGDMKQSIYRFRLADPSIFLSRYNRYPDADNAAETEARRVILSRNYRSRPEVLNACNRLFSAIFSKAAGELDYTSREALYPGRTFPVSGADNATELVLVEAAAADDDENEDGASACLQEARWVAARIREMVQSRCPVTDGDTVRPASWGDFAILLRSFSGHSAIFTQALDEYAIPCRSSAATDLFDTPEISLVLAALDCVDNPRQDIALTALMRAPMFAFTADELAALRLVHPGAFWQAVFTAAGRDTGTVSSDTDIAADTAAAPDPVILAAASEKARQMLSCLDTLRKDMETLPLGKALWHLCDRIGIFTSVAAMKYADARRANLYALFEYAYRFERSGYRGLYRFLEQLRRLRQSGQTPGTEGGGQSADCVQLMSVHKSKGLQFPIVFVSGCGGRFNDQTLSEPILVHPQLGLGLRRRLSDLRVEYPTAAYNAIRTALRREQRSEEMRVLYVAMTRAEEKLILTAAVRNPQAVLDKYALDATELPCPSRAMLEAHTTLEWLLRALLPDVPDFPSALSADWRIQIAAAPRTAEVEPPLTDVSSSQRQASPDNAPTELSSALTAELTARLTAAVTTVYPYTDAVRTPSKLTATQLHDHPAAFPDMDTPAVPELAVSAEETPSEKHRWNRPRFLMAQGLTPAERGIAQHLAMQFADYTRCQTVFDCRLELERLTERAFLTQEQAAAVSPERIVRFFHDALGRRMLAARELHREFRFSLPVSPALYTAGISALSAPREDDFVLLQGVIDAWFEEPDGLVIVDFKTDRIPAAGMSALLERYRPQVTAYAHALTRITGKPVKECGLYLFSAGQTVYFDL